MPTVSVWMEGRVTCNKAGAQLVGTVEAPMFADARAGVMSKPPLNGRKFERENLTLRVGLEGAGDPYRMCLL